MFKRKIQFFLVFLLVLLPGIFFIVAPVSAIIDSADEAAEDLEERYHINQDSVQEFGENFNVSERKGQAPEARLFFSPTNPRPGEEVTAKALPLGFSNDKETLYFTWYLKHKGCEATNSPSAAEEERCDLNEDNKITVEDWKVEAMRILANGGFDASEADYRTDTDGDKYQARFGGDNRFDDTPRCYIHDFDDGKNYELKEFRKDIERKECHINGGTYDPDPDFPGEPCRFNACRHMFPNMPDGGRHTTGNGAFGRAEEEFWQTDPHDPSTANNGNKDEANVAGLAQDNFTWNYAPGDELGVVVEGTSSYKTKYEEASGMIMWALAKNNCKVLNKSTKTEPDIRGYEVVIETSGMDDRDFRNCLEESMVTPQEGGQAENLEVSTSFAPASPTAELFTPNEPLGGFGDILTTQATVTNSGTDQSRLSYEWKVEASVDGTLPVSSDANAWENITQELRDNKIIGAVSGSSLGSFPINLTLNRTDFQRYFRNNAAYFRITATVSENFSPGSSRKGKSSVIVRLNSGGNALRVLRANTAESDGKTRVLLGDPACESNPVQRAVCPVMKNQIVGLTLASQNYQNYTWMLNGQPLNCSPSVSSQCRADGKQNHINFFPVTGDPGTTYSVTLTGSDVETGASVSLTRDFRVVEPSVEIISADKNEVWPKVLGQYVNLEGRTFDDYSHKTLQSFPRNTLTLKPIYYPDVLEESSTLNWAVDGARVVINEDGGIVIAAAKPVGSSYNISLNGSYNQRVAIRQALRDIWGVSSYDSSESRLAHEVQIELTEDPAGLAQGETAPRRFFAALLSYVPVSVLFTLRIMLTLGLILFVTGLIFSFTARPLNASRDS